jgi:Zn-dependent protease with chaperone function/Zn-finger nucleic acid-binding protein
MGTAPRDFYEIQERQRAKSLWLLLAVVVFHFVALGLVALALVLSFGLLLGGAMLASPGFWARFLIFDMAAAALIGVVHYLDARRNGPRYILKRLQAEVPDPEDRYHRQFLNTLDEIRIAAGLPRVHGYVLPSFAVNSLALVEESGTPAVAVTEGLLAECTRDELQAVAAHELAHIARGDAVYLTLVCSLANVFEKLAEALEPAMDDVRDGGETGGGTGGAPPFPLYIAVGLSALVMHLLSMFVSRERELLADAAAVELCRSPESLARALYKAQVKNSFVGDFSLTYTPLFMVPPDARDIPDNWAGRLFNSHPPFAKRIGALAAMAHRTTAAVIAEVGEGQKLRGMARGVVHSHEEIKKGQGELFPGFEAGPAAPSPAAAETGPAPGLQSTGDRTWLLEAGGPRRWEGPFTLTELLSHPRFTPLVPVRNTQEGVEAKAREFPQVRRALHGPARKKPPESGRLNLCPRCRIPLGTAFYEGVAVNACGTCGGKLVGAAGVDRIVARREAAFSDDLVARARDFRERVLLDPAARRKINAEAGREAVCPSCGCRMIRRPYNYQYVVPVDKCLTCAKIWFDSDELEVLQVLIEESGH